MISLACYSFSTTLSSSCSMYFFLRLRLLAADILFLARRCSDRVWESLLDLRPLPRPFCSLGSSEDCSVLERERRRVYGSSKATVGWSVVILANCWIVFCWGAVCMNRSALTTLQAATCPIDTKSVSFGANWEEGSLRELCDCYSFEF